MTEGGSPSAACAAPPGLRPRDGLRSAGLSAGMAGAFGMLSDHRELSHRVAGPLVAAIEALPRDTAVVASGTSCRHQIADLTDLRPLHLAELLACHLNNGGVRE